MPSKSKSRGKSMNMDSSTQVLMMLAAAAVLYMLFKGGGGGYGGSVVASSYDTYSPKNCKSDCDFCTGGRGPSIFLKTSCEHCKSEKCKLAFEGGIKKCINDSPKTCKKQYAKYIQ